MLRLRDATGALLGANLDPSHFFWQGIDPVKAVRKLEGAIHHVHAKDISFEQSDTRGTVTGTPVGCACGEGVVDWERVLHILDRLDREITLSVECGTIDQAERSLKFLSGLIGHRG